MASALKLFPREMRPHSILDPIHGLVRLTDVERAVVDHPLFRRLRYIKQNGLLCLVFPSATHTRFEHSIGALYVADAMVEQVWLNSLVARRKGAVTPFDQASPGAALDLTEAPDSELWRLSTVARLAALVHDLGHGPLSHTFDSFAMYRRDLKALFGMGVASDLAPMYELLVSWGSDGAAGSVKYERVPHEVMSCVLFASLWSDLRAEAMKQPAAVEAFPASKVIEVAAAILGDGAQYVGRDFRPWISLVHDIIASAPADADRMDYLERDSRSIGVTYGLFDRHRVLKSFLCYQNEHEGQPTYRLGIKRSGIQALENLVQARFELYAQIYFHKTNAAVSAMLKEIARFARGERFTFFSLTADVAQAWADVASRYLDLSDEQFLRALRGMEQSYGEVPENIQLIARQIHERRVWKRLYEGDEDGATFVRDALLATEGATLGGSGLAVDVSKPGATKDLDGGAAMLSRLDGGIYRVDASRNWYQSSLIIAALKKAVGNIGRVYLKTATLSAEQFDSLAQAARLSAKKYERTKSALAAPGV